MAKEAGVSTTTVSRVVNRKKNISITTQKRVNAAIKKLDYRVNLRAKSLVTKTSNIIGVVVADITNPTISSFVDALSARFHEYGIGLLLGNSGYQVKKEFKYLDIFQARKVRGVIYTGKEITLDHIRKLNEYSLPLIVGFQEHKELQCPVVVFDNYQASYDVARLLLDHGHDRIGFVSFPLEDRQVGFLRQKGYIDALKAAGHEPGNGYVQHADFTMKAGYEAAERMVEQADPLPTVIFGATDRIAIGVMKYLKHRKFRIPEDISVFGFDNIPIASKLIPSLSSVMLDHYELGLVVADMLDKMFGNPKTVIKKVICRHQIICRESCK